MDDSIEAPRPDEVHATADAQGTTSAPATARTRETAAAIATTGTVPPVPSRNGALARAQRMSDQTPESQVKAIEQRRADLSRNSRQRPFDATRPYRNNSLEHADIDPNVGWQGPAIDRSRIFQPRHHTRNTLRFGTNEQLDMVEDEDENEDEMSTQVEVTAETQWALEEAGMVQVLLKYNDEDDDDVD